MDDKHIEDLLRNTLRATPPEGMWDRTLRLVRQQPSSRHTSGMSRWTVVFAALSIAIVAFTSVSECKREQRIATLTGGSSGSVDRSAPDRSFLKMRREMSDMLARIPSVRYSQDDREGGNPL